MFRLDGKVALISGAGRGMGRSHAVRFAQEGADIIAFDICAPITSVPYALSSAEDLKETVRLVEAAGARIVWGEADVRDYDQVKALVDRGVEKFERLDVICANAAISGFVENTWSITEEQWETLIAVNVTGVWKTVKAGIPAMIAAGNGGSIAIISSCAGTKGMINLGHYSASKHGIVGLMRTLANELAEHSIRVNTIHPGAVNTAMAHGLDDAFFEDYAIPRIGEPSDIGAAVAYLASEDASFVTGADLPVDGGFVLGPIPSWV